MSTIEVYAFEDKDGESASDWTTQDVREAREFAAQHRYKLIARQYEYTDSELVEDFTEKDEADEEGDDDTEEVSPE